MSLHGYTSRRRGARKNYSSSSMTRSAANRVRKELQNLGPKENRMLYKYGCNGCGQEEETSAVFDDPECCGRQMHLKTICFRENHLNGNDSPGASPAEQQVVYNESSIRINHYKSESSYQDRFADDATFVNPKMGGRKTYSEHNYDGKTRPLASRPTIGCNVSDEGWKDWEYDDWDGYGFIGIRNAETLDSQAQVSEEELALAASVEERVAKATTPFGYAGYEEPEIAENINGGM